MKPSSVARAAGAAVLYVLVSVAAEAQQPVTKAPPRLPANPTASGRIPAGVDRCDVESAEAEGRRDQFADRVLVFHHQQASV